MSQSSAEKASNHVEMTGQATYISKESKLMPDSRVTGPSEKERELKEGLKRAIQISGEYDFEAVVRTGRLDPESN